MSTGLSKNSSPFSIADFAIDPDVVIDIAARIGPGRTASIVNVPSAAVTGDIDGGAQRLDRRRSVNLRRDGSSGGGRERRLEHHRPCHLQSRLHRQRDAILIDRATCGRPSSPRYLDAGPAGRSETAFRSNIAAANNLYDPGTTPGIANVPPGSASPRPTSRSGPVATGRLRTTPTASSAASAP